MAGVVIGSWRGRRKRPVERDWPRVVVPEARQAASRPSVLAGDTLLAAYLAATGALALASGTSTGFVLAGLHLSGVATVGWLARRRLPRRGLPRFLRVFLPVAVTPLLYAELATLNQLLVAGYLDGAVQAWEAALFGGQPSLEVADAWPSLWLSETLHAGYFSYYLIVPAAAVAAWRKGGTDALGRVTVTVALAFFLCYLCFAVFPVAGPRYEFPPLAGPPSGGLLFGLVHDVLETGSSRGTAFPSSHVAASLAALLAVRNENRLWFRILLTPVLLLIVGTVYGRFHYGVDALAGIAVAAVAFLLAPPLIRALDR